MGTALLCAAESLERTYCEIRDSQNLLEKINRYQSTSHLPNEWRGFELLHRDFPSLPDFLSLLESGITPETEAQGKTKADFARREGGHEARIYQAYGLIGETEDQIRSLSRKDADDSTIQRQIRSLVSSLASTLSPVEYSESRPSADSYFSQATPGQGPEEKKIRLLIWLLEGSPSPEGATDGSVLTSVTITTWPLWKINLSTQMKFETT